MGVRGRGRINRGEWTASGLLYYVYHVSVDGCVGVVAAPKPVLIVIKIFLLAKIANLNE